MRVFNDEQLSIINAKEKIVIAEARAGSGKSTTAIGFSEKRRDGRILYLVYNSAMKKEAERDFGHLKNVVIKTSHGLAYGKVGFKFRNRLVANYKVSDVIKDLGLKRDYVVAQSILFVYNKFLQSEYKTFDEFRESKEIAFPKGIYTTAEKLFNKKADLNSSISVEHDLYLKLYQLQGKFDDVDYVILDEAQDTSNVVFDIFKSLKCKQKLILGDSAQSIYAFRGANNVMKKIDGGKYYIPTSFRISNITAFIVNKVYKGLTGLDLGIKGVNENNKLDCKANLDLKNDKYTVICRNNATILKHIIECHESFKKIHLIGGVKSYKFDLYIQTYYVMTGRKSNHPSLKNFQTYQELREYAEDSDDIELLSAIGLVKVYGSKIPHVLGRINSMVTSSRTCADVVLVTAHKSKGLTIKGNVLIEGDLVNPNEIEELEKKGRDLIQEANLLYVALTRTGNGTMYMSDEISSFLGIE